MAHVPSSLDFSESSPPTASAARRTSMASKRPMTKAKGCSDAERDKEGGIEMKDLGDDESSSFFPAGRRLLKEVQGVRKRESTAALVY